MHAMCAVLCCLFAVRSVCNDIRTDVESHSWTPICSQKSTNGTSGELKFYMNVLFVSVIIYLTSKSHK